MKDFEAEQIAIKRQGALHINDRVASMFNANNAQIFNPFRVFFGMDRVIRNGIINKCASPLIRDRCGVPAECGEARSGGGVYYRSHQD